MSVENGKVCCNCRRCIRQEMEDGFVSWQYAAEDERGRAGAADSGSTKGHEGNC